MFKCNECATRHPVCLAKVAVYGALSGKQTAHVGLGALAVTDSLCLSLPGMDTPKPSQPGRRQYGRDKANSDLN